MDHDIQERVYYSLCKSFKLLQKLLDVGPDDALVDEIIRVEKKLRKEFSHYKGNPTWPLDEQVEEDDEELTDEELKILEAMPSIFR